MMVINNKSNREASQPTVANRLRVEIELLRNLTSIPPVEWERRADDVRGRAEKAGLSLDELCLPVETKRCGTVEEKIAVINSCTSRLISMLPLRGGITGEELDEAQGDLAAAKSLFADAVKRHEAGEITAGELAVAERLYKEKDAAFQAVVTRMGNVHLEGSHYNTLEGIDGFRQQVWAVLKKYEDAVKADPLDELTLDPKMHGELHRIALKCLRTIHAGSESMGLEAEPPSGMSLLEQAQWYKSKLLAMGFRPKES